MGDATNFWPCRAMLLDDREIGRRTGFSMVAGYFLYMAYLYL